MNATPAPLGPPRGLNGLLSRTVKRFRIRAALRELGHPARALDLGCGLCELTERLPEGIEYVGVERDRWMYERARSRFPQHRFIHADIERDGLLFGWTADVILLVAVWEHLHSPREFLRRARSWISPDGRLVITTPAPAGERLIEMLSRLRLLSSSAEEEHERLWSRSEIAALAAEEGWTVLNSRSFLFGLNQIIVLSPKAD